MPARIRLVTLPSTDPEFRSFALAALEGLDPDDGPRELERRLRDRYYDALVRVQDELARVGADVTWYAYRSRPTAELVEAPADTTAWWKDPDLPWIVIDADGVYRDGSAEAFALLGGSRDSLVGVRVGVASGDLYAGAADDAVARWRLMLEQPERSHRLTLPTPEGGHRLVETRTIVDGAGPGLHRIVARVAPLQEGEDEG